MTDPWFRSLDSAAITKDIRKVQNSVRRADARIGGSRRTKRFRGYRPVWSASPDIEKHQDGY